MNDDHPVYYDVERNQLYWISWEETGNSDIPTRHYLGVDCDTNSWLDNNKDVKQVKRKGKK